MTSHFPKHPKQYPVSTHVSLEHENETLKRMNARLQRDVIMRDHTIGELKAKNESLLKELAKYGKNPRERSKTPGTR